MDLDQWIAKVKEGQHLLEDELQLLCEYVRFYCFNPYPHSVLFVIDLQNLPYLRIVRVYTFSNFLCVKCKPLYSLMIWLLLLLSGFMLYISSLDFVVSLAFSENLSRSHRFMFIEHEL